MKKLYLMTILSLICCLTDTINSSDDSSNYNSDNQSTNSEIQTTNDSKTNSEEEEESKDLATKLKVRSIKINNKNVPASFRKFTPTEIKKYFNNNKKESKKNSTYKKGHGPLKKAQQQLNKKNNPIIKYQQDNVNSSEQDLEQLTHQIAVLTSLDNQEELNKKLVTILHLKNDLRSKFIEKLPELDNTPTLSESELETYVNEFYKQIDNGTYSQLEENQQRIHQAQQNFLCNEADPTDPFAHCQNKLKLLIKNNLNNYQKISKKLRTEYEIKALEEEIKILQTSDSETINIQEIDKQKTSDTIITLIEDRTNLMNNIERLNKAKTALENNSDYQKSNSLIKSNIFQKTHCYSGTTKADANNRIYEFQQKILIYEKEIEESEKALAKIDKKYEFNIKNFKKIEKNGLNKALKNLHKNQRAQKTINQNNYDDDLDLDFDIINPNEILEHNKELKNTNKWLSWPPSWLTTETITTTNNSPKEIIKELISDNSVTSKLRPDLSLTDGEEHKEFENNDNLSSTITLARPVTPPTITKITEDTLAAPTEFTIISDTEPILVQTKIMQTIDEKLAKQAVAQFNRDQYLLKHPMSWKNQRKKEIVQQAIGKQAVAQMNIDQYKKSHKFSNSRYNH